MNILKEAQLLERAVAALDGFGLQVQMQIEPKATPTVQADAWLRIGRNGQHLDYVAECKRTVTPATLGAILAQLRQLKDATTRTPLLLADHVTPPVADELRAHGQQFVDAAGNAYLDGPGILVFVTGRKTPERTRGLRPGRAFTPAGLRVLFVLLCNPELADAPQRTIAAKAGVALGAIPAVFADLEQTGYMYTAGARRRLDATRRLLDEWALMYARLLRPKTLQKVFDVPRFDGWQDWALDPGLLWGGEPAANILVHYLRPGILTIYGERLPAKLIVEQRLTTAKRVDDRTLELRQPFWGEPLQADWQGKTVPPALVYADLLATGDGRCIETAEMVYDEHLARFFPAH